ncbi:ATP-binding cassette sub-family C member 4-like isoform X1 [Onthophagus taurus]|uniref:ATP-binding cassette sub-family C member 4-like isoform X1 n=2 Tax=Onthophagus taurus TaxID=166361 RepID=UPI0039BE4726
MDTTKKYDNPSPESKANILSKTFFCWTFPLFYYSYKNDLEIKNLYNTQSQDQSEPLGNLLERNWNKELIKAKKTHKKPSLGMAIVKTFYKSYMLCGVAHLIIAAALRIFQPVVLAEFIRYFDIDSPYTKSEGWCFAIAVVFMSFLNTILIHNVVVYSHRIGMWCRIATCSLMYRKLLKLNKTSLGKTAAGQIVNLMSNDVQRFDLAAGFLHYIWIMPIQAIIAASVMYNSVGYSALIGLAALFIQSLVLQGYLSKLQGKLRSKIATRTDARVKLMSEITSGIQVIKMYAWEKPFDKMVQLCRKLEIKALTTTSYIRGITVALMVFTERFALYLTLIIYVLMGNPLNSDKVFSLSQFFNIIQLYMSIFFPMGIVMLAESKVSIRRIQEFLLLEEVQQSLTYTDKSFPESKGSIKIKNVKASWIPNPIIDTLSNITLNIKPGSLTAIVGTVGSGKTSLLQLLLKELSPGNGTLEINGEISYASQEPWLFSSNVKNNILFGQKFIQSTYTKVVRACALLVDFDQLPQGDKTLIGERGASLSGGQRARINLARAVYRQADIYLLDDPLSAVDAQVANKLFKECICDYLKNKTRILVTHQLQFLKHVDQIIVMNNGQIERVGTFKELSENELAYLRQDTNDDVLNQTPHKEVGVRKRLISGRSESSTTEQDENDNEEPQETQELVEKGAISSSLYKKYFKAGAPVIALIFFAILVIISQAFVNAGDLWLTHWTNTVESHRLTANKATNDSLLEEDSTNSTLEVPLIPETNISSSNVSFIQSFIQPANSPDHIDNEYYILFYTFFIAMSIILTTTRSLLFFKICMRASKRLHDWMFSNLLQATMRFFDTNPSGRILNRFSKDMGAIDETLPRAMLDAIQIFMVMSGILIMVWIFVPWVVVPSVLLGSLFLFLRIVYLRTAQDLKRLEGTSRAPVFSHVSASLSGITTIRSSKAQYMVAKEFDTLQNGHTNASYLHIVTMQAFGFYLDLICTVFLGVLAFQFLIMDDGKTPPGNVGLVISQSMILVGMLQYGMRQTAEVASQMTSVERVVQYTNIEKEGPFESPPTKKPESAWPKKGEVRFENLYLKYCVDEEPVLKNLNINIQPGEKIGIVGRTGAGKSSLISALFRIAPFDGHLFIDDVDTKEIGLHDLRTKISIIPQEPVLFSATVRHNLDPFDKSDEAALWKALENVELKDGVETLEQQVTEGGTNFSVGQRQLICLARAIIKNNKILVLDEATANVDPQTDALIQETIKQNFKDCTVLTIAHRLNTIMDSDRVLVMDNGEAVEFDSPHLLLEKDGNFSAMVEATGKTMENKLRKIAKDAYLLKKSSGSIMEEIPLENGHVKSIIENNTENENEHKD